MMENNKEAANNINKLIRTNTDRVAGYQKALEFTSDPHLRSVFEQNRDQSSRYLSELRPLVTQFGGDVETDTSTAGDMYRGWMDIKDALSANSSKSVLQWCEKGEDVAKKAYNDIVTSVETPFDPSVREILTKQQSGIESMHDQIKSLRDAHEDNA